MLEPALATVAATFAVVSGVNDGGSLVSTGLKLPTLRVLAAVGLLAAAVAIGPLVFGTRVASTLTNSLVAGDSGRQALMIGVVAALAVVAILNRRGLPSSITLALLGGIAGAGLGYGAAVAWSTILRVLVVAAAAPIVGGVLAYALVRICARVPPRAGLSSKISGTHPFAFALQSVAYAMNDGQKMLAIFAVATSATIAGPIDADPRVGVLMGGLFAVGAIAGLPKMLGSIGDGVLATRPVHTVAAEVASATAVLTSAAIGYPVSITQSLAGGLIGAGMSDGYRRVRWQVARRIALAWLFTLPASAVAAAAIAAAVRIGAA